MAAPKKGKDLSALKARLAKKAAAAAPPADVPAPGEVVEAAAEAVVEAAPPAADIPAPGEVSTPAAPEIPPPGEVYTEPEPAYEEPAAAYEEPAAAYEEAAAGEVFGGGAAFDPDAGLVGGDIDVAPRKGRGLTIFAGLLGALAGGLLGYVGHDVKNKNAMKDTATAKAKDMLAEVKRVQETTAKIRLRLDDVKKSIVTKPEEGATALAELLTEQFGPDADFPKAESLFGWQLAALHPSSIKSVFNLYNGANALAMDLGYLAQYVNGNAKVISDKVQGPARFAVVVNPEDGSALLVELTGFLCGEGEEVKDCAPDKVKEATFLKVRNAPGGPEGQVERAKAFPLAAQGAIFKYAIGDEPGMNATITYQRLMQRVEGRLEAIVKDEKRAVTALDKYLGNPTTDDSNKQGPAE